MTDDDLRLSNDLIAELQQRQSAAARQLVERLVANAPGDDRAWKLVLTLLGPDFESFAQRQFDADQFEERPLIWLAQFPWDKGNKAVAEKFARQAVAIDPSDGKQGPGDRMRVYAIVAQILKDKGDPLGDVYAGAVRAIRMSEHADANAGLQRRALKLYQRSLNEFSDAYCIQSRLAVQLARQGEFAAAEPHFRRAFELMPDSFGRMESHCSGCEGVFREGPAMSIFEVVFLKLLKTQPANPRLHYMLAYMLGYLRESQQRIPEAVQSYRRATQLDPDYINAWEQLASMDADDLPAGTITPAERDDVTFALLRLDPHGRHTTPDMSAIRDLKRLWEISQKRPASASEKKLPPLLELTAAKQHRAKPKDDDPFFGSASRIDLMGMSSERHWMTSPETMAAILSL